MRFWLFPMQVVASKHIQMHCNTIYLQNKFNYMFIMPVKICSLILDQGDYLLRFGMKGQKETKENPVDVEFDFTGVCSKKAFQSEN